MQSVCVYCGSSPGVRAEYQHAAEALADQLVARDLGLVYGGAHVGLMGSIADRVLARGGSVTGVEHRELLLSAESADNLLTSLMAWRAVALPKLSRSIST